MGLSPDFSAKPAWHVARIQPNLERIVQERIRHRLDYETYSPFFWLRGEVVAPVFPCYLFIRFDSLDERWPKLYDLPGVVRCLPLHLPYPLPLPDSFIETVQQREVEGDFDLRDVKRLSLKYKPGDAVSVVGGMMAGVAAQFVRQQKEAVALMMSIFGRPTEVLVPLEHVAVGG